VDNYKRFSKRGRAVHEAPLPFALTHFSFLIKRYQQFNMKFDFLNLIGVVGAASLAAPVVF
jgi:hypothetical protein